MIEGLEAFSHGQIQDALNILRIMEKESITTDDLKKHVEDIVFHPPKSRRGFMKKTTKVQRAEILKHKGLERVPCKRCDEKRRGKK